MAYESRGSTQAKAQAGSGRRPGAPRAVTLVLAIGMLALGAIGVKPSEGTPPTPA